jgi:hypothetical protein
MTQRGEVVELHGRSNYRPDIAALACQQVAAARLRLESTPAEFAELLSTVLQWEPTPEAVEAWESGATPPGDVLVAAGLLTRSATAGPDDASDLVARLLGDRYSDLTAVFDNRAQFASHSPPATLFDRAGEVKMAGLSLNLLCQSYPVPSIRDLLERGGTLHCLFLDPTSAATTARELEEGYRPGELAALTALNISTLLNHVRRGVSADAQNRLQIAVYDEPVRFNLTFIDSTLCVMQPYLPATRGGDSPTFLIQSKTKKLGLYRTFEQVFNDMWERGRLL